MKRFTHDADLRGMVVLRSLGFQLVPFKLHRFRKQRPCHLLMSILTGSPLCSVVPSSPSPRWHCWPAACRFQFLPPIRPRKR
ncbi:hypothetical protein GO993_09035 [Aeromonas salmonicida subsp. salmonicida]|uniref:hypothetical protein n=1 Tax=Aeromonas salmonicida TaxID=645 RepID=UPI00131FD1DE|nr:hypothetical protein [Aeromonas salmonicida]QHE48140.1 hypothetical protein GO994_13505 [Aeromonas salmonicida subsp. salmonicida]QJF55744.1 hypothetical protein GO993_09035 [Aeromonas salmonicida subsp. salmonicida]